MAFLRPLFIDNMGWHMAEVYGAVTDQILINLARYFPYWKPGQSVPQSSFEYQAHMLAQMGQVTQDTIKIIRASLGSADNALTNVLEQAIMEAVKKAQPDLFKAVQKGLLNPTQRPVVDPSQMRAYSLYYQQAAQKLNMVNTVMLESTQQAYQATVADIAARVKVTQNALDIGAGETITGVSSWNQAVRHSIDRMKANGITGFIDHAGHKWSAEAYTAMDIRTTVANTARAAVWETNQDFGNDLYIVSYHDGARPLCYPWQNKVISSTDNARVVTDLDGNEIQVIAQKDTSYGEPAGLFGINCKHYPSPFIPGVSVLYNQNEIMSEKENERVYEQTQQQRALERQIREQKRDLLMAKAQGASKDELNALRAKIRETDDDIDTFCKETGLPRRQSRESAFTQRSFPPEDTYDVDTFERTQKEEIDKFFNDGGSQQGFTFGTMTPNETVVPTTPPMPTPTPAQAQTPVEPAQPVQQQFAIDGNIEKLKGTLSDAEYQEVVTLVQNGETGKLYEKYGDALAGVKRVRNGGQYTSYDVVEYDITKSPGMHKYSTMAHEMAHMFDAKIGEATTLTFNEVATINEKCKIGSGMVKTVRVVPSTSDQFLAAMRRDKAALKELLNNAEELQKMKTGTLRNASGGVQDAMDGFFGTQDKNILPWGHGNTYYNRWYNRKIKDWGHQNELKDALNALGFNIPNLTAAKQHFREYRTASELWANVVSALTCGGEELEAFKRYMPETVKTALEIIRGL